MFPRQLRLTSACCFAIGLMSVVGCYRPYEEPPVAKKADNGSAAGSPSPSYTATASDSDTAATPAATVPESTVIKASVAPVPVGGMPSASPSGDKYFRPARTLGMPVATVEVRPSRSPVRKTPGGEPPPRTRVQAAPPTEAGVLGITFDDLMFPIERDQYFEPSMLNDSVRALLGKKVKIRGFMNNFSAAQDKGLKRFILMRDDQGCCFGPGAYLYDCIDVRMVPGQTTNFSTRVVAVEGVLTISVVEGFDGRQSSIFRLDAESAE